MSMPVLKLRQVVGFPGNIVGTTGIEVTKANGTVTIETDWNDFGAIDAIPTAPTSYILTFDTATQEYVLVPSHLLGGAVAGIADAPVDGTQYGRKNAGWTPIVAPASLPDAPSDGTLYGRKNATWTLVPAPGIADAPSDGTQYGRTNGAWTAVLGGAGATYTAGAGLTLTGNVFSIGTAQVADAMLAAPVSAAKGGTGRDYSASTGIALYTGGTSSILGTTGTGSVVRTASPTLTTPTVNSILSIGGSSTPQVAFGPSSGATLTGVLYQQADFLQLGVSGVGAKVTLALGTGNVGIGTTNPLAKLEVAGDVRIGGDDGFGEAGICNLKVMTDHFVITGSSTGDSGPGRNAPFLILRNRDTAPTSGPGYNIYGQGYNTSGSMLTATIINAGLVNATAGSEEGLFDFLVLDGAGHMVVGATIRGTEFSVNPNVPASFGFIRLTEGGVPGASVQGQLFVSAGQLAYKGTSGTVTVLAPA